MLVSTVRGGGPFGTSREYSERLRKDGMAVTDAYAKMRRQGLAGRPSFHFKGQQMEDVTYWVYVPRWENERPTRKSKNLSWLSVCLQANTQQMEVLHSGKGG